MTIKLSCLACGHLMTLGDAYADYQGEVRCWGCRSVLEVSLEDGRLKSMKSQTEAAAPELAPPPGLKRPGRAAGREMR